MSDIAKKTLPPGSWPGSKSGPKTADTASEAAAPRSAATPPNPKDVGTESVAGTDEQSEHYTHQTKENLEDIEEEEGSGAINMTDDDAPEESVAETEKVGSAKGPETATHDADESVAAPEGEDAQENVEQTPASSSEHTELTEEAKKKLDEESEHQSEGDAKESLLQTAKDGATTVTGLTGLTGKKSQGKGSEKSGEELADVPATENAPDDLEEKAGTEVQGTATSEPQEPAEKPETVSGQEQLTVQPPAPMETAPPEEMTPSELQQFEQRHGTQPDDSQEPPETAKTAPTEGTQAPARTENTATGVDVQDMATEGYQQEGTQQEGTHQDGTQQQQQDNAGTAEDSMTIPEQLDFSVLKNGKVNKGGNVIDSEGKIVGRVVQGILEYLVGKKVDENGDIWSDNGKVIGKAEPITDSEREDMLKEPSPFESFPDAVVDGNGMVVSNGEWVGKVVSGDISVLRGKSVDADGDILDKAGNVIGHAERWEPEPEAEAEPEPEVDNSILAGKRVNKAGNVVDSHGTIFGRVIEGDVKKMIGRMCNKQGHILSESGDILGKAEVIPEGEREGQKEGPFAELEGCTVAKDGTVVTPGGDIVGRLTQGDGKVLFGRAVDEDGDVLDRNGNVIGKAERWSPEEVEHKKNPMTGRKVNREGNVVDEEGNIIGKLTSGDPTMCSGKAIDEDGDVVDFKGTVIGHCTLLEDLPSETEEEKAKKAQIEQDKKLAAQMSVCVEQCLDKIRPICKMINDKIDAAERTPEDERDEEALVREVRPLIEEGGRILSEAKGAIKGLDPDGRIAANAKHKTAAHEATPEEYHLADVLKDLTGDVSNCIEDAKRKLEDMPHAKKELNPLWGLLTEPLGQILAGVGLLLAGVLGLVGRLLSGLGLGGLLDGLLGTLGLTRVLEGLGLGGITGSKKKTAGGKKSGGGLLGGILG